MKTCNHEPKQSIDEMMAVNTKEESDDSSIDHNYNDVGSIIMDDVIKTEIDSSDNEIVWQTG